MYTEQDIDLKFATDGTPTFVTNDLKFCTQAVAGETKRGEDFHYWYRINEDRTTLRVPCRHAYDYVFSCESGKASAARKLNELLKD